MKDNTDTKIFRSYASAITPFLLILCISAGAAAASEKQSFRFITEVDATEGAILIVPNPSGAIFFLDKSTFETCVNSSYSLNIIRDNSRVFSFERGRQLIAISDIHNSKGKVHDERFGDGYIVMFTI